jgi:hypothetical protein
MVDHIFVLDVYYILDRGTFVMGTFSSVEVFFFYESIFVFYFCCFL